MAGRPKSDGPKFVPFGQEGFDSRDPRHGRRSTYTNLKCRCEPCTKANTNASRTYKHGTLNAYNGHIAAGTTPCLACEYAGLKSYMLIQGVLKPGLDPFRSRVVRRDAKFYDMGLTDLDKEALIQGNCRNLDQERKDLFTSPEKRDQQEAAKICQTCPVQGQCLLTSLLHPEDREAGQGTWGGTTAEQRERQEVKIRSGEMHPLDSPQLPENKS